jgi:hypothetical protein
MSVEIMRDLLRNLGAELGLPDLAPDDAGYCCLSFGDAIRVSVQYEPENEDLVLFARLCQIEEGATEPACEMMMAGNLFWADTNGGTLAMDATERFVFLLAKERVQSVDFPRFMTMLERFVQAGEDWQERLRAFTAAAAADTRPVTAQIPMDQMRLV